MTNQERIREKIIELFDLSLGPIELDHRLNCLIQTIAVVGGNAAIDECAAEILRRGTKRFWPTAAKDFAKVVLALKREMPTQAEPPPQESGADRPAEPQSV